MALEDVKIMTRADFKVACTKFGIVKGTDDIGKQLDVVTKLLKDPLAVDWFNPQFKKLTADIKDYTSKHGKDNPKFLTVIKQLELNVADFVKQKQSIDERRTILVTQLLDARTTMSKAANYIDKTLSEDNVNSALKLIDESFVSAGKSLVAAVEMSRLSKSSKFSNSAKLLKAAVEDTKKIRDLLSAIEKTKKFNVPGEKIQTSMGAALKSFTSCVEIYQ